MAPTGQTVTAVLLALGLARGPSDAQPPDPAEDPEASVSSAEPEAPASPPEPEGATDPATSEPEGVTDPATSEPEAATDPAAPEPELSSDTTAPEVAPEVAPNLEETAPAPPASEPATTEHQPAPERDGEDDEAWADEAGDQDETWDDEYDPLRDSPEALAAGRRIAGGAVVLGLGAVVSFGGLAMVLSDPCARPAGNSCSPASRNRAALTMGLPGLAAVAVGSVMLALGIRQRKALRLEANLTPFGGGIAFRGRF